MVGRFGGSHLANPLDLGDPWRNCVLIVLYAVLISGHWHDTAMTLVGRCLAGHWWFSGGRVVGGWRESGGTVAGQWRDSRGTVVGQWRDSGGTVAGQ